MLNLWRDFLAVLRDGFRIWWLAPMIPLLVVIPEAIQHVAEIRIGMFDSIEEAREVAEDPRRMVWGYLKIAGLVMAILAAARFWGAATRGERWWDLRRLAWRPLALGLAGWALAALPSLLLQSLIGEERSGWLDMLLTLATLPIFTLIAAGLAGDGTLTLKRAFTRGWLPALRMLLFLVLTWGPLALLHAYNHRWAMGAGEPLVWLLMAVDSLVVGLLATMAGTAIYHGYASLARDHGASPPGRGPVAGFTSI